MADASICGLGQAAPNPIACVIKYFPQELNASERSQPRRGSARIARDGATSASGSRAEPDRHFSSTARRSALAGRNHHRGRATRHGVEIPHLCYKPGMRPDGNCRACMVEIKGERVLAPSCCRAPATGHGSVERQSRARVHAQKMVVELLAADVPEQRLQARFRARATGSAGSASASRASQRARSPAPDLSHPAMAVNLDACIQCTRCVRACREEQVNDVIGYAFRGAHSKIVFDLDDPMGASTCVACGECVQACPTGALAPAKDAYLVADRQERRLGLPVLRRRLPAHLSRQGQRDRPRRRPRRPRQPRAGCA